MGQNCTKLILSTALLSLLSCELLITDVNDIARKTVTQAHSISRKLLMKCQGKLGTESSEAHVNPIHRHRGSQTYGYTVCPNPLLPAVRAPSVRKHLQLLGTRLTIESPISGTGSRQARKSRSMPLSLFLG